MMLSLVAHLEFEQWIYQESKAAGLGGFYFSQIVIQALIWKLTLFIF